MVIMKKEIINEKKKMIMLMKLLIKMMETMNDKIEKGSQASAMLICK